MAPRSKSWTAYALMAITPLEKSLNGVSHPSTICCSPLPCALLCPPAAYLPLHLPLLQQASEWSCCLPFLWAFQHCVLNWTTHLASLMVHFHFIQTHLVELVLFFPIYVITSHGKIFCCCARWCFNHGSEVTILQQKTLYQFHGIHIILFPAMPTHLLQ